MPFRCCAKAAAIMVVTPAPAFAAGANVAYIDTLHATNHAQREASTFAGATLDGALPVDLTHIEQPAPLAWVPRPGPHLQSAGKQPLGADVGSAATSQLPAQWILQEGAVQDVGRGNGLPCLSEILQSLFAMG